MMRICSKELRPFAVLILCCSFPFILIGQEKHKRELHLFHPSHLSGKKITIKVTYSYISCTCAQWVEEKYESDPVYNPTIWLEPANDSIKDAEDFVDGEHICVVKVTGQFYTEEGWPNWPERKFWKGHGDAARVFHYEKIEQVKNRK